MTPFLLALLAQSDFITVGTWLAALAGILTFSLVFWKKILIPVFHHVKSIKSLVSDVENIVELHQQIDFDSLVDTVKTILVDLRPNSGTSLRDAIDRIEARLIQMERVQGALRQDGPIGIFRCTTEGKNIEVNRTYARWLQATEKDLLGFGWKNFVVTNGDEHHDDVWHVAFQEGRELEMRLTLQAVNGETFWVDMHAYPITDKNGNVIQYLGILYKVRECASGGHCPEYHFPS